MQHPCAFRPEEHAVFDAKKMGKATLFESPRLMLGLNCFEPGQEHKLHAHAGLDKVYQVLSGEGVFVLAGPRDSDARRPACWWLPKASPTASATPRGSGWWCSRSSRRRLDATQGVPASP